MTKMTETSRGHDRFIESLLTCLASFANEPFPKTASDCKRLIATRGHMLPPWQRNALRRWFMRQFEPENGHPEEGQPRSGLNTSNA